MSSGPFPYDSARRRSVGSERYPGGMCRHGVRRQACREEHELTLLQRRSILHHRRLFLIPPVTCRRLRPLPVQAALHSLCLRRVILPPHRHTWAQESCLPSTRDPAQPCPSHP